MDHDILRWSEFADRQGELNPVPDCLRVAEWGFNSSRVVPVEIAQHEREGAVLPVKFEGLVAATRLNHVDTTTLADCGDHLAQASSSPTSRMRPLLDGVRPRFLGLREFSFFAALFMRKH